MAPSDLHPKKTGRRNKAKQNKRNKLKHKGSKRETRDDRSRVRERFGSEKTGAAAGGGGRGEP